MSLLYIIPEVSCPFRIMNVFIFLITSFLYYATSLSCPILIIGFPYYAPSFLYRLLCCQSYLCPFLCKFLSFDVHFFLFISHLFNISSCSSSSPFFSILLFLLPIHFHDSSFSHPLSPLPESILSILVICFVPPPLLYPHPHSFSYRQPLSVDFFLFILCILVHFFFSFTYIRYVPRRLLNYVIIKRGQQC